MMLSLARATAVEPPPVEAVPALDAGLGERVRELETILDTATDGVVIIDGDGRIAGINRTAEALFGTEARDVIGAPFTHLLAEESRKAALDYIDGLAANGVASVLNDGREVIGKVPRGGLIPLFMTIGRARRAREILRRASRHHTLEERRGGARRSPPRGRGGERAEVGIPRQDQPRDQDAAQRHHRLLRGDDGGALRTDRQRSLPRATSATSISPAST